MNKEFQAFYRLPEEGEEPRPVFYAKHNGRIHIGVTPYLRLMFTNSIHAGIPKTDVALDMVKNLFGYASESGAKKSRIYFTNAELEDSEGSVDSQMSYILGEPKPSSYLEYLCEKGSAPGSYNNDEFRLRGIKQYWLHDKINQTEENGTNTKVVSSFTPLKAGNGFAGKIRFSNLSEEELGLLLLCLDPSQTNSSEMNLGKAKAHGFGRIKIGGIHLKLVDNQKLYGILEESLSNTGISDQTDQIHRFVSVYDAYFEKKTGHSIYKEASIKEFITMKTLVAKKADSSVNEHIQYMSLKEYANFKRPSNIKTLPTVEEAAKQLRGKK